jgi:tRNA dimethylallyltransferase
LFYSPKIITIIGPTASGKTNLSIKLAKKFNGEIINADSRLFYRGMDIGTSKPNKKELQDVKHHLINIMPPEKSNNLHDFLIDANNIIKTIIRSGKTPIIVGGTGQYIWALHEGWKLDENPINKQLRNKLEKLDLEELQKLYYKENSSKSSDIDIQNKRRIIRFIEKSREGNTNNKQRIPPNWNSFIIGLHLQRNLLHSYILLRINRMLKQGLINEIKSFLDMSLPKDSPFYNIIGYREFIPYINNESNIDKAIKNTVISTNRLVRHQYNWFKLEDKRINWFNCSKNFHITERNIIYKTKQFLNH